MESLKSVLLKWDANEFMGAIATSILEDEEFLGIETNIVTDRFEELKDALYDCDNIEDFNNVLEDHKIRDIDNDLIEYENNHISDVFRDMTGNFIECLKDLGLYDTHFTHLRDRIRKENSVELVSNNNGG
jgi:hypothetical protein